MYPRAIRGPQSGQSGVHLIMANKVERWVIILYNNNKFASLAQSEIIVIIIIILRVNFSIEALKLLWCTELIVYIVQ